MDMEGGKGDKNPARGCYCLLRTFLSREIKLRNYQQWVQQNSLSSGFYFPHPDQTQKYKAGLDYEIVVNFNIGPSLPVLLNENVVRENLNYLESRT